MNVWEHEMDEMHRREDEKRQEFKDLMDQISRDQRRIFMMIMQLMLQIDKPFRHVLYRN